MKSLSLQAVLLLLSSLLWTESFGQVTDRWTALSAPTYFQTFIINPVDTNIIYATYYDGTAKSIDGGANWTLTSVWTADNARSIIINPVNRDTLYMGVEAQGTGGRGIYRTANRGSSWTQLYSTKSVRCVILDPRRPHLLYAGTVTNNYTGATVGLLVSTNTGTTWTASNTGLTNLEIRALAIDPTTTTTIYAGTESGVFKSTNSAGSWIGASSGLPAGSIIRALAVSPSKPAVLLAGTQGDGLFKSTDGGSSWFAGGSGITNGVISSIVIHPTDASTAYVSVQNGAVFRTRDGGSTWTAVDLAGVSPLSETVSLTLNPLDPRIIYGLFNSGTTAAAIYKLFDPAITPPAVSTGQALSVTSIGALLNGTVNPNNSATTAYFEWGTSNALIAPFTTPSQSLGSGASVVTVTAPLTGLNPNTTYYFRVVAQNAGATQRGLIVSFTTPARGSRALCVSTSGNDASAGTESAPLRTIQSALAKVLSGDTIKVGAGTFTENLTTSVKSILRGGYDATFSESARNLIKNKSIIKPSTGTAITDGAGSTIDGFVIDGIGGAGKGILVTAGNATVTHNVAQNYTVSGGSCFEVAFAASAIVKNNTAMNNMLSGGGVIIYTFYIKGNAGGGTVVQNNIAYNNDVGISINAGLSGVISGYNCAFLNRSGNFDGAAQTATDLTKDPRLVNPSIGDVRLKATSPCANAGNPSDAFSDEPAPNGGRIDLGAYGGTKNATPGGNPTTYVSTKGDDANNGSLAAPYKTIQTAIGAALGDTIKVTGGTYSEGIITSAQCVLMGGYEATFAEARRDIFTNKTILLGVSTNSIFDRMGSTFDGFFLNLNNAAANGFNVAAGAVVSRNVIVNVSSSSGCAIRISGAATISNNTVRGCSYGIYVESGSAGTTIRNNIVVNGGFGYVNSSVSVTARYNDLYSNSFNYTGSYATPGIGDISINPQFRDVAASDYRLSAGSPCIDSGDPISPLDPDGTRADMGAYPYSTPTVTDTYESNNTSSTATPIAYGFTSSGADLKQPGDVDYFKFTASAGDFIAIEAVTDDASQLDLRLALFDATGTEVAVSDIVSIGTERILYGVGRAQQYYIRVVEATDTANFPNGSDRGGSEQGTLGKGIFRKSSARSAFIQSSTAATPAYTLSLARGSPLPPVNLSAGAGFNGLVPLRWLQPASNGPTEYRIYRGTSGSGSFDLIGSTWRESFVDTTAANGTLYFYIVKSVYDATNAESGPSNIDKATPRGTGFKLFSRFSTVKPVIDGQLRAGEWVDAQAENIVIRRATSEPPSVTLLVKNDAGTIYVGVIDSNASLATYNRLILAFDSDFNKKWDKTLPSSEGFLVIDDSAGVPIVRFYGVSGNYPDVDIMDEVRDPKGITARFSYQGSSLHYELSIDLARVAPVVGTAGALGMYVNVVSDEFNGEYPLQAIVLAPSTFADIILAKPTGATTLVSPLNGSMGVSVSPTLSWNPMTGAAGYRVQVSTDSNFVSTVAVDQNNITGTSYTATGLATGTVYFWRVMTNATGSAGTWSTTWRFTTYLGMVSLVSPADKVTGVPVAPTLSWNAVKGAASYHLQVSFVSSFASTVLDQSDITNTSFGASGLSTNTLHYWRVEAVNAGGSSGWSSTWSFTTVVAVPSTPSLTSPANNGTNQATTLSLTWSAANGATAYHLQVAVNSSFAAPYAFEDSALSTTTKQLTGLAGNSTYYWRVRGKNAGGSSSWSSTYSFVTIGTKTVTSTGVAFPSNPAASTDYRLVTFPGTSTPTVGDVLSGSQNSNWRIFEENGAAVPNNLSEMSASSTLMLGEGYWLLYKGTFSYSRSTMMPQLWTDGSCIVSVRTGWNIIGNPFDVPITWASVKQFNSIAANIWSYTGSGGFQQSSTLDPFKGYYFYSSSTQLKIPYPFPAMKLADPQSPPIDWRIQLVLETDLISDAENYVGVAPGADVEGDDLDQEDPPPLFNQSSLSIVRQREGARRDLLSADFRPSIGDGQVWKFEVSNPGRSEGKIRAIGIDDLPLNLEIRLIGATGSGSIDLRRIREFPLPSPSEKTWFSLAVGSKAFVDQQEVQLLPKNFGLFQNYPNPFNPKTVISYQLPALSRVEGPALGGVEGPALSGAEGPALSGVEGSAINLVTLRVFDLLGREVATLVNAEQTAGRYQVSFDAGNLTSGVYFYRLEARQTSGGRASVFVDTKKLILVK